MFKAQNKVRMHDTDMAGILYFPRQFRFIHDAWEDMLEAEGISFEEMVHHKKFLFVVVHAEADYFQPLKVGDELEVQIQVVRIGNTSFTMGYEIFKKGGDLVGTGKTVHVCLDSKNRSKIPIPDLLMGILKKYYHQSRP